MSSSTTQYSASEGVGKKLLLVPGLVITTVTTILLLCSDGLVWTNSGDFYRFVHNNRATVQIIVQVLASVLDKLHIAVVCSLISFSTRLRLAKAPRTLDHLRFWSALYFRDTVGRYHFDLWYCLHFFGSQPSFLRQFWLVR